MSAISPAGLVTGAADAPGIREITAPPDRRLNLARATTAKLLALLYLQDIFWLVASRLQIAMGSAFYSVSGFEWVVFAGVCVLALFFSLVGAAFAYTLPPLSKIFVSRGLVKLIILMAIAVNLLTFVAVPAQARYTGGLTGALGVLYGFGRGLTLCSMILFVRHKFASNPIRSKPLLFGLVISFLITVDGLSNVLTLMTFIILMMPALSMRNVRYLIVAAVAAGILLAIGLKAKFALMPDYVTPDFLVRWAIARFAIQAEHMYTFIAGQSIIGEVASYLDLIVRAVDDRFKIVLGKFLQLTYPRSVAEALYYDARGFFGAGSSPGILLGTALQGPFFFIIVPAVYAFLFLQVFYGINQKVTFIQLCAFSYLLKGIHANFSEFLTIISPTLLTLAFYLVACLFTLRKHNITQSEN